MTLLNKFFSKNKSKTSQPKTEELKPKVKEATFPPKAATPRAGKTAEKIVEPKILKPANMEIEQVIIGPHITEKASAQKEGAYIFKVARSANKITVARAVGSTYNVKVKDVNIINISGKTIKVGRTLGRTQGYKKAVVTLKAGQTLEIR